MDKLILYHRCPLIGERAAISKVAVRKGSLKQLFLNLSQNTRENICGGIHILLAKINKNLQTFS